jgi:hypothetical protein
LSGIAACYRSRKGPYKQSRTVPMETVRLCSARSESLRRTFPRQGEKLAACTRSLFRPWPGRRVENARRLSSKLRLKPPSSVEWFVPTERPLATCLSSGVKGRSEVTFPCPTRMPVRLFILPRLQTLPSNWPHSEAGRLEFSVALVTDQGDGNQA